MSEPNRWQQAGDDYSNVPTELPVASYPWCQIVQIGDKSLFAFPIDQDDFAKLEPTLKAMGAGEYEDNGRTYATLETLPCALIRRRRRLVVDTGKFDQRFHWNQYDEATAWANSQPGNKRARGHTQVVAMLLPRIETTTGKGKKKKKTEVSIAASGPLFVLTGKGLQSKALGQLLGTMASRLIKPARVAHKVNLPPAAWRVQLGFALYRDYGEEFRGGYCPIIVSTPGDVIEAGKLEAFLVADSSKTVAAYADAQDWADAWNKEGSFRPPSGGGYVQEPEKAQGGQGATEGGQGGGYGGGQGGGYGGGGYGGGQPAPEPSDDEIPF